MLEGMFAMLERVLVMLGGVLVMLVMCDTAISTTGERESLFLVAVSQ